MYQLRFAWMILTKRSFTFKQIKREFIYSEENKLAEKLIESSRLIKAIKHMGSSLGNQTHWQYIILNGLSYVINVLSELCQSTYHPQHFILQLWNYVKWIWWRFGFCNILTFVLFQKFNFQKISPAWESVYIFNTVFSYYYLVTIFDFLSKIVSKTSRKRNLVDMFVLKSGNFGIIYVYFTTEPISF